MSQVLALKYRPKRFEDLIGQSTISQTLSLALDSGRLSHAYLLSGLRGSGKTSTARILAKSFLCEQGPTSKPCEVCDNCKSANSGQHLDIIEMDAASNRGIDDIKDLIEHIKYKPTSAKFKVFIIDEIHMLTTQAFNALLKTLEEPPEFVKFILATTDPLKLPATILSRTQHFRFNKIPHKDVINHLIHILNLENNSFEEDALDILARGGQGSLRDTLTMLDQAIIFSKGNITTTAVVDMLGLLDPKVLDQIFDIILDNADRLEIIELLGNYEASLIIDEMVIYLKDRMLRRDPRFNTLLYDRYFRILADAKHLLFLNSDNEFVILLTISKLIEASNLKTIDEIIDQVESVQVSQESSIVEVKAADIDTKKDEEEQEVIQTETKAPPVEIKIDYAVLYKKLNDNIYDRNFELGECFENNFKFITFVKNTLLIASSADGECKKLLWKNFAHIRTMVEEIFGEDTDIKFEKIEQQEEAIEEQSNDGSSCMQNTIASTSDTMTDAQHEYTVDDIEQSQMFNNAKELFKPTKIVVTTKA